VEEVWGETDRKQLARVSGKQGLQLKSSGGIEGKDTMWSIEILPKKESSGKICLPKEIWGCWSGKT